MEMARQVYSVVEEHEAEIQRWIKQYYEQPGLVPEDARVDIERVLLAIRRAVLDGLQPGSFSRAVLCNDLRGATGHASETIRPYIWLMVRYVYNEMPSDRLEAWR